MNHYRNPGHLKAHCIHVSPHYRWRLIGLMVTFPLYEEKRSTLTENFQVQLLWLLSVNSRCSGIGRSCLLLRPLFINLHIMSLRGGTIKAGSRLQYTTFSRMAARWLCKNNLTGKLHMCSDTDEVELSVMRLMAYTRNVPLYHKWPHHRKLIGEFDPSTLDSYIKEIRITMHMFFPPLCYTRRCNTQAGSPVSIVDLCAF
jgi:hypothetical protein